ncbi:hypothetical protein VTI74DRAFT_2514 [Chaetomium olivicolor]
MFLMFLTGTPASSELTRRLMRFPGPVSAAELSIIMGAHFLGHGGPHSWAGLHHKAPPALPQGSRRHKLGRLTLVRAVSTGTCSPSEMSVFCHSNSEVVIVAQTQIPLALDKLDKDGGGVGCDSPARCGVHFGQFVPRWSRPHLPGLIEPLLHRPRLHKSFPSFPDPIIPALSSAVINPLCLPPPSFCCLVVVSFAPHLLHGRGPFHSFLTAFVVDSLDGLPASTVTQLVTVPLQIQTRIIPSASLTDSDTTTAVTPERFPNIHLHLLGVAWSNQHYPAIRLSFLSRLIVVLAILSHRCDPYLLSARQPTDQRYKRNRE